MNTAAVHARVVEPPVAGELIALVARFMSEEIVALIHDDKVRFRVQVAANLLQICQRELDNVSDLRSDADGYAVTEELIREAGSLRSLTDSLLRGDRDILEQRTFDLLRRYVNAKLRIAAPKILQPEKQ